MAGIDTIIASSVDAVKKSGALEAGALLATVTGVDSGGTLVVERGGDTYPKVRLLSGYNAPSVGDLVVIFKTAGGWVSLGKLVTSSAPKIQSGKVAAASTTANTWVDTAVSFPKAFAAVPHVVVSPSSGIGATTDLKAIVNSETTTGFTVRVWRGNTTSPTFVNWIATDF